MSQKLDMLGVGMQRHQNDPNGIAWRQNRDFENLLQRLNEGTEAIGPFHRARGSSSSEEEEVAAKVVDSAHDADDGADATKREKKKKKRKTMQEKEEERVLDKRERKKRKKLKSNVAPEDDTLPSLEAQATAAPASGYTPVPTAPIAAPAPVRALYVVQFYVLDSFSRTYFCLLYDSPRAHRARIIAAKRMAASNSTALAEILGIPSSSSSGTGTGTASPSPFTTATAATTPVPATSGAGEEEAPLQKLTTATQSVGDYLRAKLGAKAAVQHRPKDSTVPLPVTRYADKDGDGDGDAPRAGLGAARLALTGRSDESVFAASKFAAMFVRGQDTADAKEEEADGAGVGHADTQDDAGDEEIQRKSARRRAKEERRREKEERRLRKEEAKSRAIAEPVAEPPNDAPVVEPSIGETRPGGAKRRKHRDSDDQDDSTTHSDGRTVVIPNTKQKKRDKGRKTGRDANP
jgi:Pin2-interacting protein X1